MKNNCVIFVSNETLEKFFAAVHPQIKVKYILVSHGGDYSFPSRHIRLANDPRIIVWFTMNMDKTHPKVKPLPIGFTHEHHYDIHDQTDDLFDVLNRINRTSFKKRHLLYLSFVNRLPCRRDVYNLFANVSFCYNPGMLDFENYLETLASSKFVLAPRGTGPESYRVWESLYCGSYPIVLSSPMDPLYDGLPVVIVKNWADITEEFLNQKYEEMKTKSYLIEKTSLQYWLDLIDSYRNPSRT